MLKKRGKAVGGRKLTVTLLCMINRDMLNSSDIKYQDECDYYDFLLEVEGIERTMIEMSY